MYSWITDCETKDEYIYSCSTFERWLGSLCTDVKFQGAVAIEIFCKSTLEFVLQKMLPYESRWVRYLRLHNNSFDNITTSVAESNNSMLKRNGMRPCDALHVTGSKITSIIRERYLQTNLHMERMSTSTGVKGSFFVDYNDLTPYALKLVTEQWDIRDRYASARMSPTVFYVRRHIRDFVDEGENPIPVFIRVQIITVIEGIARCSCGYIGRYQLPCRHFLHVFDVMRSAFCGVRWMKLYAMYYGTKCSIAAKLKEIQILETDGIKITDELQLCSTDHHILPVIYRSCKPTDLQFFSSIGQTITTDDFVDQDLQNADMRTDDSGLLCFGRLSQPNEQEPLTKSASRSTDYYNKFIKMSKEVINLTEGYEHIEKFCEEEMEILIAKAKQLVVTELSKKQAPQNQENHNTKIVSSNIPGNWKGNITGRNQNMS